MITRENNKEGKILSKIIKTYINCGKKSQAFSETDKNVTTASPLNCQVMNKVIKVRQKLNIHPYLLAEQQGNLTQR